MPELPEVEHARRKLLTLRGARIDRAIARDAIVLGKQKKAAFARALAGRTLEGVDRRGKSLLVRLSGGAGLAMHLGMTGSLVIERGERARPRFSRVSLETDAGTLHFDDPRKLGRLFAGSLDEARRAAKHDALGPDALTIASAKALAARFDGVRAPIKSALLEQSYVAGLGNIHAGEALFLARLHPLRSTASLDARAWSRLYAGIHDTLARAFAQLERLEKSGEDLVYVSAGGENPFLAYGRAGEPCPRCGRAIVRQVHGGRATYVCTHCQPRW
jgi:formamidopyrimidine-DNA glycosylase